jgi:hypothetical protein
MTCVISPPGGDVMSRFNLLVLGLVVILASPVAAQPNGPAAKVPAELLRKRLESARSVYRQTYERVLTGQQAPAELFGWSERWLDAELALADKENDRVKALKEHLDRTRDVEHRAAVLFRAGQGRQSDADTATYYRIEAEIRLIRAGGDPQAK